MSIPQNIPAQPEGRLATPPFTGAFRTTLGAAGVATVLIGGFSIANPVLAAAAVAVSTGVLSGFGKVSRDHLAKREAQPEAKRGFLGTVADIFAMGFSWLG